MNATTTDHAIKRLPLLARLALVLAALVIGGLIAIGNSVVAVINTAYFGRPSASLGALDWVAAAVAIYCVLAALRGRWRLL